MTKKYHGNTWQNITPKIYNTSTDTLTTLPAEIIPDGQPFSGINLIGNMQQTGTPSQSSPIYPSETGDKTENLYNYQTMTVPGLTLYNSSRVTSNDSSTIMIVPCEPETTYTVSVQGETITLFRLAITDSETVVADTPYTKLINSVPDDNTYTLTTTASTKNIIIQLNNVEQSKLALMVNKGSTAKPFEPYGYKIPVSCGSTTVTAYTAEPIRKIGDYADSKTLTTETRVIKKLVLTGEETGWNSTSTGGRNVFYLDTITPDYLRSDDTTLLCSHYKAIASVTGVGYVGEGETALFNIVGASQRLYFGDNNYSVVDNFKTYLQQQYAAGTPVTVWYVLATPTTESVSMPAIPTAAGSQQFDVDTTLKPSEVDLTYHGWHPKSDKEYSGGSWS